MLFITMVHEDECIYDEFRVIFDQYLPGSLKEAKHDKRTIKNTLIHHQHDNNEIKNIKKFQSHIGTKAELTYLSD